MISLAQIQPPMISAARVPSAIISAGGVPAALISPAVATPFKNAAAGPSVYAWLFGDDSPMLFGDGTEITYA